MNNIALINVLRFVIIGLLQVLVLNQIYLHNYITPIIYPLFIMLLPFETPKWVMLLTACAMGFFVDIFSNTPGLHAAAITFMAYARPIALQINKPVGDYDSTDRPTLKRMGLRWFTVYVTICLLLHHIPYYFLQIYSLDFFVLTVQKIILSVVTSLMLIIISQYVFGSAN